MLSLIVSILIFSIGMNELAEVGIGSFIGEGYLEVNIPGEEFTETILCSWGPNIGFYLYVLSILLTTIVIIYKMKNRFKKVG